MLVVVFDVESVGLHGEGFAVGAVVVDTLNGATLDEFYAASETSEPLLMANPETLGWLEANVLPHLWPTHEHTREVRDAFWQFWRTWAGRGAKLLADCAWPVEARFLAACVDDDAESREWQGPYPLLDLAPILWAQGIDPTGAFDRTPSELPQHHPLNDARQSARLLLEALKRQRGMGASAVNTP